MSVQKIETYLVHQDLVSFIHYFYPLDMSRYEISLLESLSSMERNLEEQEDERVEQAGTVGEVRVLLWTVVGMAAVMAGAAVVWAWCKIRKVSPSVGQK